MSKEIQFIDSGDNSNRHLRIVKRPTDEIDKEIRQYRLEQAFGLGRIVEGVALGLGSVSVIASKKRRWAQAIAGVGVGVGIALTAAGFDDFSINKSLEKRAVKEKEMLLKRKIERQKRN